MRDTITLPNLEFCFLHTRGERVFRRLSNNSELFAVSRVARTEEGFLENSVLKWLLYPTEIAKKLEDPNFALYGNFVNNELVGFTLLRLLPADSVLELALCCVLPQFRMQNIAVELTLGVTIVADQTSAHLLYADAVCFHNQVQTGLESLGFSPFGFLPHFETFGSHDTGIDAQQTLIRYVRFPKEDPTAWVESLRSLKLTPQSLRVLNSILAGLHHHTETENNADNVVPFPHKKAG
jgi:hypothetical protein